MCCSSKRDRPRALAGDPHLDPADVAAALPGRGELARRVTGQDGAIGVAVQLILAADAKVAGDRQEPPRDALDVGTGVPEIGCIGVIRLTDRDDTRLPRLQCPAADGAPHGVDLMVDVNHVALLRRVASRARFRLPARRGVVSRIDGIAASHSSTSRNAAHRSRRRAAADLRAHRGEAVVPQHFQVLRYRRLADANSALDGRTDRTRCQLAVGEQFEDAPADRIAQDIEGVHSADTKTAALI